MANKTITQLPIASLSELSDNDVLIIVVNNVTKQVTLGDLKTFIETP
jgi:hypothetical protein|tara:strand:+ start:634 stop:774 length:141 start_codon:yes stop_codon:yes gene_type:complete